MPIKTKEIKIESGGDEGKTFVVSQMPLMRGDKWSNRVKLALLRGGVDVRALGLDDVLTKGKFTGLVHIPKFINMALKALGGMEDSEAQALLDELTKGVRIKLPDGETRDVILPTETEDSPDITDINTLWKIRIESIKVNIDFLMSGVMQK